jgi:kynureninase
VTDASGGAFTREDALALDRADPLGGCRSRFQLSNDIIYLDGNSLGVLPVGVAARVSRLIEHEWGQGLIRSWNAAGWIDLPQRVAGKIAPLIGARAHEVLVADSTSVNLFKLLVAAARLRPDRRVLVMEPTTFPTDGYIAASVARLLDLELRWCDPADPLAAVDERTAVLALTHVDFRTGRMYDIPALTRCVKQTGALVLWDLCHSAGAVPVDLRAADADLAVGCTYKYLNGGPGAPAYLFVAERHHAGIDQPLPGWMGHAEPFAMEREFRPAPGIASMAAGSPTIVSLAALDAALDVFAGVDTGHIRAKSLALTGLFIDLVLHRIGRELEIVTPLDGPDRGSQVSVRHPRAYEVVQALIARGIIGDFRAPDLARFGFAPLYTRFVDAYDAACALERVLAGREWDNRDYDRRSKVT